MVVYGHGWCVINGGDKGESIRFSSLKCYAFLIFITKDYIQGNVDEIN